MTRSSRYRDAAARAEPRTRAPGKPQRSVGPLDRLDGFLQRLQEAGAVGAREAGVVALALAGLPQVAGELAHGHGHADIRLGERFAGRSDDARAGLHAARSERDVGRDDDVLLAGPFR